MKSLLLALALTLSATQTPSPANTGVIEGTVTSDTNPPEPIGGMQVQLNTGQALRAAGLNPDVLFLLDATTDDKGHFVFKDLYPGRYQLRVMHDGYFPVPGGGVGITGSVLQNPGPAPTQSLNVIFALDTKQPVTLSIPMRPGGVISGRVQDSTGRAVTAGQVVALRLIYQDGHRTLQSVKTATTNDRGEYRLFGLEPGDYYVRSDIRRASTGLAGIQDAFRIYFPGVNEADRALKISVTTGSEVSGTNLTTQTATTIKISGTVMNMIPSMASAVTAPRGGALDATTALAQALAAPTFSLVPRDPDALTDATLQLQNSLNTAADRAQGKFEISGVQPGHYELYALVREVTGNNITAQRGGHVAIDVGNQDIIGITIVIRPLGEVRARFTGNGDAAIQSQIPPALNLRSKDPVPPQFRTAQQSQVPQGNGPAARAAQQEAWHVYNPIVEGSYVLESQMTVLRDAYVADIRQGDKSIYETGTITVGSSSPDPVEIILARPAATIDGTVQNADAKPAAGIQVVLIPNGARRENPLLYKRATSGADGQFNLRALAPGGYKLFAWESIPNGAEMNAEFMKDFDDRGIPITVEAGAQLKVQLPLISAKRP